MNTSKIDRECEKHGIYQAEIIPIGKKGQSFYREHYSQCPKCYQEENKAEIDRNKTYLLDDKKAKISSNIRLANIPKRYQGKSIYDLEPVNEKQKEIQIRCLKYVANFNELYPLGTSLVFTGKPGTGKTHFALSMIPEIVKKYCDQKYDEIIKNVGAEDDSLRIPTIGQLCLYVNTYDLFTEIKSTYNKQSEATEKEIFVKYSEVNLLIIDEVGVQAGTDYEKTLMFRIINSRYENMKPTFIISNLSEADLSEYIGERTIDRFYENHGAVFIFDWDSKRRE